jgi:hypothetical protein
MTIYDYAQLSEEKKQELVEREGVFIETYEERGNTVTAYYLRGIFVEITKKNNEVIYNLPYQRGFKIPCSMLTLKDQTKAYSKAS